MVNLAPSGDVANKTSFEIVFIVFSSLFEHAPRIMSQDLYNVEIEWLPKFDVFCTCQKGIFLFIYKRRLKIGVIKIHAI
jgi:hypothetical protein